MVWGWEALEVDSLRIKLSTELEIKYFVFLPPRAAMCIILLGEGHQAEPSVCAGAGSTGPSPFWSPGEWAVCVALAAREGYKEGGEEIVSQIVAESTSNFS